MITALRVYHDGQGNVVRLDQLDGPGEWPYPPEEECLLIEKPEAIEAFLQEHRAPPPAPETP